MVSFSWYEAIRRDAEEGNVCVVCDFSLASDRRILCWLASVGDDGDMDGLFHVSIERATRIAEYRG